MDYDKAQADFIELVSQHCGYPVNIVEDVLGALADAAAETLEEGNTVSIRSFLTAFPRLSAQKTGLQEKLELAEDTFKAEADSDSKVVVVKLTTSFIKRFAGME